MHRKKILVLFIVMIAASQLQYCKTENQKEVKKTSTVTKSEASNNCKWDEIPFVPPNEPLMIPDNYKIPVLKKIERNSPNYDEKILEKFFIILENVPVPGITHQLIPAIKNKKVRLEFDLMNDAVAAFGISHDGKPTIFLNISLIAKVQTESEFTIIATAIIHEFVHYKQWQRTKHPLHKKTFKQGFSVYNHPGLTHKQYCELSWLDEREAHYHECLSLHRLGFFEKLPNTQKYYCERIKTPDSFDQALFTVYVQENGKNSKKNCLDVWSVIVKHPCHL